MPILQINFKLNVPVDEYAIDSRRFAPLIADVPGLCWKIWIINEEAKEAGGIYFFGTEVSLNQYVSGPIVAQLRSNPAITNVSVKQFDVMEDLTSVTRGSVAAATAR
jgi:hypothetical protein